MRRSSVLFGARAKPEISQVVIKISLLICFRYAFGEMETSFYASISINQILRQFYFHFDWQKSLVTFSSPLCTRLELCERESDSFCTRPDTKTNAVTMAAGELRTLPKLH